MDKIEFTKADLLKGPCIPLGMGKTAICYLTPSLEVVKLYKHNNLGHYYLDDEKFPEKLERISNLSNDTYIGPKGILLTKNKFVGYTYDYCGASTISHLDGDSSFIRLFINYDKLLEDTKKISDAHFRIRDRHSRNMLFDGNYHMIDLEHGEFQDDKDVTELYEQNASRNFRSILKCVYGVNPAHTLVFDDKDINLIFNHMSKTNLDEIEQFQKIIADKCSTPNPNLKKVKQKVKAYGVDYGYKGSNEL